MTDLELSRDLLVKSKQKFIVFVRDKIMKQIRATIAEANQKLIDQEIKNYELNNHSEWIGNRTGRPTSSRDQMTMDKHDYISEGELRDSPRNSKSLFSQQFA